MSDSAASVPSSVVASSAETAASEAIPSDPPARQWSLPRPDWLTKPLLRQTSCWMVSMLVHMGIFLLVATFVVAGPVKRVLIPDTFEVVRHNPEDYTVVLDEQTVASTEIGVSSTAAAGSASGFVGGGAGGGAGGQGALASVSAPSLDGGVASAGTGSGKGIGIGIGDVGFASVPRKALGIDVPEGSPGDAQAVVDTYQEAMDRITQEILVMLLKSKVLVVWCFDESESMKDDQKEILQRVERVYQELGLSKGAQGDALLTAVCSFGEKWKLHTKKPTYNAEAIREAIDSIGTDASGKEMLCQAVGESISQFRSFALQGQRQMVLIVVTDESGDRTSNVEYLEAAINEARQARCRVYMLGREAVFGYPFAHMRWRHPNGGTLWLPIDRGPETANVEQLQTDGFQRRYDAHASGFGPYEQSRICRETGGVFFMLPSLETDLVRGEKRRYELEAMRPYLPDLLARSAYAQQRDTVPLRATLWKVISDLNPYDAEKAKVIDLRHHFSADPAAFVKQVQQEQEKARQYVTYLHAAEEALDKLRTARDQETHPRWRANYDLILGQVLAYKVRVYEYGAYLEEFKRKPKQVPIKKAPNLTLAYWAIQHRPQTITGEKTDSYIERSKELFQRTMELHAGTPWAARAQWELKRGFGIELHEVYHGPPNPNPRPASTAPVKIPKL